MITGETEYLMMRDPEDGYDNFLFFGKKAKARRQEKKAQRQAEGKSGRGLLDLLSSPGLGNTINNVAGLFKKGSEAPSDYQVSVGGTEYDDSNNNDKPPKDNTMLIVGGVIVAGILVLAYTQIKKNKTLPPTL
ncbi:hypothetical protein JMN32_00045 [Fulvivirga sp. 29W222]|uniref:Uncharacterized protein n=1 Tax=Fulvivirga marina TaxID=2494733 RepID=A0A937KAL2_9BACT|nr:hypothetical protein [Fulvivirga marina]MBL6444677.1 hypothetical protein [Fulvivirga marina]